MNRELLAESGCRKKYIKDGYKDGATGRTTETFLVCARLEIRKP